MTRELEVLLGEDIAGHLVETEPARWSFVYRRMAGDEPDRFRLPVSLSLPRSRPSHHGAAVHAVFANLLPDGELRRRLARSLGLSEDNELALLARLAGDCAGALRLRAPGTLAAEPAAVLRTLTADELRNAMAVLPVHPLLAAADDLRVCLPGEFDKLPVRVHNGSVTLVPEGQPSTHILKPARPGLRESVMNEAFVMAFAQDCGLPTAITDVLHGPLSVLCVTRVDRVDGATVTAINMEDFCQLSGLPASAKYEREGGPRLLDIIELVRRYSVQPALDVRALLRWLMFSFLVGFGAAHAKQLALLHTARGPRLAPFFGLWSTHVYPEMNERLGYAVGGEDRPDWLTATRWADLGVAAGLRPAYVLQELRELAITASLGIGPFVERFQKRHGFAEIVRAIRVLIEQRARQVIVSLEAETPAPGVRRAGRPRRTASPKRTLTTAATAGADDI